MTASRQRWLMISSTGVLRRPSSTPQPRVSVVAPVLLDQFHMDSVAYSRVVSAASCWPTRWRMASPAL